MDLELIYKDVKEISPLILKHKMPSLIYKELTKCLKHTANIKKNKLSCLLEHVNAGENSYQVSLPFNLIEGSFLQAYIIHLGEYYRCKYENLSFKQVRRTVRMRKNGDHFDSYDLWVNYTKKGAKNKWHCHAGSLSGVIYYTDCKGSPTCFEGGFSYKGKKGEIIIFPNTYSHKVNPHMNKSERITLSYNLYYT